MSEFANDVAVIGMACRFPGAATVEQFWANLAGGQESIRRFAAEELLAAGLDPAVLNDPSYVRAKPIIESAEWFDAAYFGFSPREAELTDPQHRVFLEVAVEALERSGLNPDDFGGPVGVFAGAGISTYLLRNLLANAAARGEGGSAAVSTGNLPDCLATRVAYKLNLRGPAYAIQCACSTSLVAVHAACQSLLNFECDAALAGGVAVNVPQVSGYHYQADGVVSPDGHCRPFDAAAAGTLFGNGAGVVVLQRLTDALASGYPIAAIIRGSAVNNDGGVKAGFAAPSVAGQAEVIREALANAGIDSARAISYVEAHGTATPLGDPVEVAALTAAFRSTTAAAGFCALGSVKSNFGHLDTAGGVAGLIKTVLALQHRQIPASVNFRSPNPKINFAGGPFFVNAALREWSADPGPRRAGVSAFGVGGTNAHLVVEEAAAAPASGPGRPWALLALSAKTETALGAATGELAAWLTANPDVVLADVAHTLQRGRRAGEYRRVVAAASVGEAAALLRTLDPARVFSSRQTSAARRIAFLFPGQGAQAVGMGRELYGQEAEFRRDVDRCCETLLPALGFDLRDLLFSDDGQRRRCAALGEASGGGAASTERLKQTDASQPALFVIEYALARLWMSWGVTPQTMIGHSLGEYVAACLAGVFSLEDALTVVAARGRLTQALPRGEMLAVPLPPAEVRPLLNAALSLAIINTASSCVVAGVAAALEPVEAALRARGFPVRRLDTSHAFHSPAMDAMLPEFARVLGGVTLHAPRIPFISNLTGKPITDDQARDPQYWVRQTRQTVYFADGIAELTRDPERVFLEVGPGMTLSTLTRQNLGRAGRQLVLNSLPDARERKSEAAGMLTSLGRLWLAGVEVNWKGFSAGEKRRRVVLPTYPFERQKYWIEPDAGGGAEDEAAARRRNPFGQWFYVPGWKHARAEAPRGTGREVASWTVVGGPDEFAAALAAAPVAPRRAAPVRNPSSLQSESASDYGAWFGQLDQTGQLPSLLVDAWSLGGGEPGPASAFYRLLALVQGWARSAPGKPLRLVVILEEAMAVRGDEAVRPEYAALTGLAKVISQEFSAITVQCIDVEAAARRLNAGTTGETSLINQLAEEIFRNHPEPLVAFRGNLRWTRTFDRVAVPIAPPAFARRLKPEGVYLITGGLGGIGLAIAESLAETVRARLVLAARTPLPPREQWSALLAAPAGHAELKPKLSTVLGLEAKGARVLTIACDVAQAAGAEAAVAAATAAYGRIDGVIHAAGVAGGGLIPLRSRESAEQVLGPKIGAIAALSAALKAQPLDFIVVFSSLAGLAGGIGQSDYCAANAFLDGWAWRQRFAGGPPVIALDWDVWRETGMAVSTGGPAGLQSARLDAMRAGLSTREGVAAFHQALDLDYPQVAISTLDLPARIASAASAAAQAAGAELPAPRHTRPNLICEYVEPAGAWESRLAALWQGVLGFERVGALDNFFDLGGDSLSALALMAALKRRHDCDLSVTTLYEFPTLRLLSARLGDEGGAKSAGPAPANAV